MVRDVLRRSEGALVIHVGGNAGRAKGVVPDLRLDSGVRRAALHSGRSPAWYDPNWEA